MKAWALLIAGAITPFLFASVLSSWLAYVFLALIVLLALWVRRCSGKSGLSTYFLLPVAFLLVTLAINQRLAQRLPASENNLNQEITGTIGSLPEYRHDVVRFLFLPENAEAPVPSRIRVSWYQGRQADERIKAPELHAGERWQLQLELRTTRRRINFHGVDMERWYFADKIGALANVQSGNNLRLAGPGPLNLQAWRESVLARLNQVGGDLPAFRVLAALAIADRQGLSNRDRNILSATGTGHLLAISGLHIGLAAAMGFYLGRFGLILLPPGFKQRAAVLLPWLVAWLAALSYAALAGFGISTQRALVMFTVATVAVLSRRNVHPMLAWLIAMAAVLLVDPFAPLRAGFWFSFIAVAVLMALFVPRFGVLPAWRKMLMAQVGISVVLAPLGMYWFQQASLPGLLANLVAIPVISILVVPLILAALLVLWLPGPLAAWLLAVAAYPAHWLFLWLAELAKFQPEILSATRAPGLTATMLAMLGAAMLLLPRGISGRYAGLMLMLPLLIPVGNTLALDETQIDLLDVGQGLAVLLGRSDYLLLYDTGPGNGLAGEEGWDMVAGTILPMIAASGKRPDLIVASHADLDHAGGLKRLQTIFPEARYLANSPFTRAGTRPCLAPARWFAGGLDFRVLHPSRGLPYLGNDSSCVISANGSGLSLLLSGDISRAVEQRLVHAGLAAHTLLTVPHHGSATSSSAALLATLQPSLALISAAANNRFGFPRPEVLQRYRNAKVETLNTAQCGGIQIRVKADSSFVVRSARKWRKAIWRWPAEEGCP